MSLRSNKVLRVHSARPSLVCAGKVCRANCFLPCRRRVEVVGGVREVLDAFVDLVSSLLLNESNGNSRIRSGIDNCDPARKSLAKPFPKLQKLTVLWRRTHHHPPLMSRSWTFLLSFALALLASGSYCYL